jgi:protein TonB
VAATAPPAAHAAQDDGADPLDAIRELIESHLVYPPMARLQGIEGTVGVRFDVSAAGEPTGLAVVESSGFEILDEAALATVERAAPLPLVSPTVKVPVVFQLE